MATPDLRNVLGYVRRFRDKVFVIAIDGSVIADDNFSNVLMDIAALHSLSIRIVIVHGAAAQIRDWSESRKEPVTDVDGTMPADAATLRVARLAAGQVSNQVLDGLYATNQIRGAVTPAVKAKPAGVIKGVDHLYRGRVDQVDKELLDVLLRHDIVPVVPPIGTDALGQAFRLNSDDVAQAVARALGATKLVFLTDRPGVTVKGQLLRQVTSAHLDEMLKTQREALEPSMISKMEAALEACQAGVRRSHIIDGRVDECLVNEVFSNEGIGTMIHVHEYQSIRVAQPKDASLIWAMTKPAVAREELLPRTRSSIQGQIGDYYVFEADGAILGCVGLRVYPEERKAEIVSLLVRSGHQNQGIGTRLSRFVEEQARKRDAEFLFCLSTQAFSFFEQKIGFKETTPDFLPPARREMYVRSARNSKVLMKSLAVPSPSVLPD